MYVGRRIRFSLPGAVGIGFRHLEQFASMDYEDQNIPPRSQKDTLQCEKRYYR